MASYIFTPLLMGLTRNGERNKGKRKSILRSKKKKSADNFKLQTKSVPLLS